MLLGHILEREQGFAADRGGCDGGKARVSMLA